ncbi:MAG: FlgD immunoglobulin-like domain containing protein [bacterium]|nr:FlgD immunoglobulin-like domain containing protein [bacterium]
MKKCFMILSAILIGLISSPPAQAKLILPSDLVITTTEMAGTGFSIDQKVEGDILTLTFDIVDKADIRNFGFGLKFDPNEYKLEQVESGFIISSDNPDNVSIGSLFTLKDVPKTTVITLRKKGDKWGTITPQELNVFTSGKRILAFEPAPSFVPKASAMPKALTLGNYPNPFNPETEIRYSLPADGLVELKIYNMVGQVVRTLVSGHMPAGEHVIKWNATDNSGQPIAGGIYFYKLTSGAQTAVRRMLLLK